MKLYISLNIGKSCPTEILEAIFSINAEGRPIWKPMHMQPYYRMNPFITRNGNGRANTNAYIEGSMLDVGQDIFNRGLCLPSDNKMTEEQQDRIIEIIRRCFDLMYKSFFKRFFDFVLSLIALIVLSPVILVVAILVKFKLGSPIIFKQKRPGKNEKIFTMYKFRTMTDDTDEDGNLLPEDDRLLRFGRVLRSTSLDELPELFNILKGIEV